MRKVIVNSTPLIALAKCDQLDLLKKMYGHIIIPDAVYREVTEKGRHRGAQDSRRPGLD